MSRAAAYHTSSGIKSYDDAEWEEWAPDVVDCVLDPAGVSAAYQRGGPNGSTTSNEVSATPCQSCLLLWDTGSPRPMEVRFAGKTGSLQLKPGEGVFIPKDLDTRWIAEASSLTGVMHMHFAADLIDRVAAERGSSLTSETLPFVPLFTDAAVRATVRAMFEEARRTPPSALLWDAGAIMLTSQLLGVLASGAPSRTPAKGGLAPWQLRRVDDYLSANFASKVSLAELADIADLSVFHFARAFKATSGITPHGRLVELRISRGCELLETTDRSITEIALDVGYESSQSFARAFREIMDTSPGKFRAARRS